MALSVRTSRARHVRHRSFDGVNRGGGRPRLERLSAWLDARSTALTGTGTATDVDTVDFANDELDIAAHPFATGDVVQLTTTTTLPTGLDLLTDYLSEVVSAGTIALNLTNWNLVIGSNAGFTDVGTGTHTVTPATAANSFLLWLLRKKPAQIQAATDIDDL